MYAIILQEVIFIVSVELPTLILGPLELFLSELITHTFNALCCYQVITSCMQFKWKSSTAYILYREIWAKIGWYVILHFVYFPNSYVHSFLPNCQVRVTFLCWNNMLGYFNNFILKICGCIIYPTKGFMFLPFMWGILHGFKLTM